MSDYCSEHVNTRQKILSAAKKEFADKGFSGARMSSIAKAAAVNQALLHYYFSSKINIYINIFRKLMGGHFEKYINLFNEELDSWNAAADIKLCGMLYAMVIGHFRVHDRDFHRIVLHEIAEGKGVIYEMMKHYLQPQISNTAKLINEGIGQGIFETTNPVLLSFKYISFINHISHLTNHFDDHDSDDAKHPDRLDMYYNFMTEMIFKELLPSGKKLSIPVLDDKKRGRINSILEQMKNDINSF